ncbi:MAG TPA: S-methyl-5'-thioinosine phosphorylase [Accumulibacter sp.]|nr:S-methyl-5'-thioinosine phosphorylase [Accumulibacter sp.]HMW18739.1 S-methyl-5'-thioinosine phosphorylase [Accumulibacter sp.]HMX22470.1 S-methyl-5'-thioinosine phosphorylase [Accumulibacter sp.]HMY07673.1 S-methyl-5'-thioinosine phosphorylase [Accumulibacter sp.]HNC18852.1 S-methyl-5'-thioinosine phosphorylase [Accumulibacter sp.]
MLAVIGGSGLSELAGLHQLQRRQVTTPYGDPSSALTFGRLGERAVVFLARHGDGHRIPPHQINYRANIRALADCSPSGIVAVATVGGIRAGLEPGDLLLPHQIIDYTWGRQATYHQLPEGTLQHIDFTEPYDAGLRQRLRKAAARLGLALADGAIYAATQGPRLETAAEIDRLHRDGADVVGMTGMPEAALARELGVPYAAINVVANHAAGRGDSRRAISLADIDAVLATAMQSVRRLIEQLVVSDD